MQRRLCTSIEDHIVIVYINAIQQERHLKQLCNHFSPRPSMTENDKKKKQYRKHSNLRMIISDQTNN